MVTAQKRVFYEYLALLCEQIHLDLLRMNGVHMDETRLQCLEFKDRVKSYMICGTRRRHEKYQMTVYSFSVPRKADFITDFLRADFMKALMTMAFHRIPITKDASN